MIIQLFIIYYWYTYILLKMFLKIKKSFSTKANGQSVGANKNVFMFST